MLQSKSSWHDFLVCDHSSKSHHLVYFHNGLFSVWKINIEVKESTEDFCLVPYDTCTTGYYEEKETLMFNLKFSSLCRLATELLEFNRRKNESPSPVEEETIQISDDYSMLAQSLDDLLADDISDEGFAELDSSKVRT